ncbi:hypothetical protein EJ08DRAFT_738428 [Tothia fuscella]|uniref:F-box domain-containing protein n=1 Tax=Tothia fuscella TaxID=1048955 RepID=A0A9P4TTZ6_9PEZI|nr:hypothetical protein EJ08DRAFT_738428 [Tothia fuscella]
MDSLPVELLEAILANLPVPELYVASNVCKSWRRLCVSPAISITRQKLRKLVKLTRLDGQLKSVRTRVSPFIQEGFDRKAYLARIGGSVPEEFSTWILEYPIVDSIGWHWPGIQDENKRERFEEFGIDWADAMSASRHLKPGYTMLSQCNVVNVEDPDYSLHNKQHQLHYPGSYMKTPSKQKNLVRALLVWTDQSRYTPRITLLILDGTDQWDGHVWLTETSTRPKGDNGELSLDWIEPLGSWTCFLEDEGKLLRENNRSLPHYKVYRRGGLIWTRPVQ